MKRVTLFIALCTTAGMASGAVYRCEVEGQITFSQTPCAANAQEYQVDYIKPNADHAARMSEQTQSSAAAVAASQTEREIRSQGLAIKDEEANIRVLQSRRDKELAALRSKKNLANNNLAGATWEQSISDEMNAVNGRYDAQISEKQTNIQRMSEQIDRLRSQ
ncbi:MAG: DUF4124 domain-containing protein [Gammaproteobacteria bacterium]|nr:DUF4124 domain-containing protein [Gammaproteobacteria bacterium]